MSACKIYFFNVVDNPEQMGDLGGGLTTMMEGGH
jgi:hypothetical protein